MLQSDSRKPHFNPDNVIGNNDTINNKLMSEIEKDLENNPYDMISLVFLLYEVPDTALQHLIAFQQVSNDPSTSNHNLMQKWFQRAKHTPNWKHEFLEALLLCQLYNLVGRIGFHVATTRNYYQTDNISTKMYINPIKKALYKLCENINAENLFQLRQDLLSHDIDTAKYYSCEQIFLKLICDKFITVEQFQFNGKTLGLKTELDKLLIIIERLPGLQKLAQDIYILQQETNKDSRKNAPIAISTPFTRKKIEKFDQNLTDSKLYSKDFKEVFGMLDELCLEESEDE